MTLSNTFIFIFPNRLKWSSLHARYPFTHQCRQHPLMYASVCFSYTYLHMYLFIYSSAALLLDLASLFSFLIMYTDSRTPWKGDQHVARPLSTHRTIEIQNKHIQTSMSRVGFEPMIPVFERAKTVDALDRAAGLPTYIGCYLAGIIMYTHVRVAFCRIPSALGRDITYSA
jgi:hypothetical protein